MKNKGISFFEQHVEKFVLGGAGVVFLSVLAWQLFPNSVKLDGKDVSFSDIDTRIAEKAQQLDARLKQPAEPLRKQLEGRLVDAAPVFIERLGGSIDASPLPSIQPRLASALQSEGIAAGVPYHVPAFPAATMLSTRQVDDTLDPSVLVQHESLKERFTPGAPLDISWAVPSAVLDLKAMRAELESDRDGAAIPKLWYRSALYLVDVTFERERMLADGAWGERTTVAVLPGGPTFRGRYDSDPDAALRDTVWTTLDDQSSQRAVVQPDFLPTKRGNFSPGLLLASSAEAGQVGEDPAVRRLRKEVARRQVEFQRVQDDLKELGGPLEEQSREERRREEERKKREEERSRGGSGGGSGGASRPGGGLGGGGLSGGMSGGRRNESSAANDEATKERRIRMTKRLGELERRLKDAQDQLSRILEEQGLAAAATASTAGSSDMMEADELVVWCHDIGVEAGNRYRYRAVVHAYNPFFTNAGVLVEEQKALGAGFTLATAASGWSAPFEVTPPIAFFVVDAVPGEGRLGVGQATVEIYRYFDGERRRERVTLQPGDSIAAAARDGVDYDTGYFLVDVVPDPIRDRGGNDRRPTALAVVQSSTGETYQVRVPASELRDPMREEFDDQIELAKSSLGGEGNGGSGAGGTSGGDRREDGINPRG